MDEFAARWVIEYLIRTPIDDSVIERLLSALSYSKDDSQLKKGLLLRKIRSKMSNGELSEEILGLLESVGELEFREEKGKAPSEAMKAAYCAVAVACTVKFLECNDLVKLHDTVERIWRVRVTNIEKSENSGLVTAKLLSWRKDLDAAIHDVEFRDMLLSRNLRYEALKALNAYIAESWKEMGPTLMEKAHHLDKIGQGKENVMEASNGMNRPSLESQNKQEVSRETIVEKENNEKSMNKTDCIPTTELKNAIEVPRSSIVDLNAVDEDPLPESSQIAEEIRPQRHRETQNKREVFMGESVEKANNERSMNKTDCIPTPESRPKKAVPPSSFVDLNAVVNDPLPESLQIAEDVMPQKYGGTKLGGNNETQNKQMVSRSQNVEKANNERNMNKTDCIPNPDLKNTKAVPGSSFVDLNAVVKDPLPESSQIAEDVKPQRHRGTKLGGNNGGEMNEGSLMPIDETDRLEANRVENITGVVHREKVRGSRSDSLKIPVVSSVCSPPLKKRKFWSNLEEDTLRDGVRQFGRGNWKAILDAYSVIFQGRTYVDLKDKWRNMTQ